MRNKLKNIKGERKSFTGIFERYGTKTNFKGYKERTILLIKIKDSNGNKVASHIWFNNNKQFDRLAELKEGDKISFEARVKKYIKGWHGRKAEEYGEERYEEDYKLSHPTKITKDG